MIKGAFQQVLSSDDQPFTRQIGVCVRGQRPTVYICFHFIMYPSHTQAQCHTLGYKHPHTHTHILDFSWPLAIALGFKLPVKIAQFGFKIPAIWSRRSGSLQSCQYKHTVSSRLCACIKLFLVVKYSLYELLRMSTDKTIS